LPPGPFIEEGARGTTQIGLRIKADPTGGTTYLGVESLGDGANRVENSYRYPNEETPFTLIYDPLAPSLSFTVDGVPSTALTFPLTTTVPSCFDFNYLRIFVRDVRTYAGFALKDMKIGTHNLGNFPESGEPAINPTISYTFSVSNLDFVSNVVEISGILVRAGDFRGNEGLKVEILFACGED
jgi:hypothetical protein